MKCQNQAIMPNINVRDLCGGYNQPYSPNGCPVGIRR
jgi:hypothetical protein